MIYTLKISSKNVGVILGALGELHHPDNIKKAARIVRDIEKQLNEQNPQAAGKKRF